MAKLGLQKNAQLDYRKFRKPGLKALSAKRVKDKKKKKTTPYPVPKTARENPAHRNQKAQRYKNYKKKKTKTVKDFKHKGVDEKKKR